ncbi:hypothetical protein ABL78_2919 [Leptomonas seymouri]|uniref:F-box domain-containing protein n=1 Tax=Leptomonas seymouri TaxID=5684 RepID=A0A0N1PE51_LEPSE|nr:hypothetical protein ABL78_2919 [Leptomonas seymouri]|eukprot:KPI87983.1 hypothetical protein ABL78_2919 [Leptomonas seymouri]
MRADKQSQPPAPATETIPDVFVRYLKAASDCERQAITRAHAPMFQEPIITALNDARRQFNETLREVREACRMIDAVSGSLEYTGTPIELQPGETKLLLDEDTLLRSFANSLTTLLEARDKKGDAPPSAAAAVGPSTPSSSCAPVASPAAWFAQPALVLEILSYLPANEIFVEAENVCRSWQAWLFDPGVSRFFWVGCVQREFPQQLAVLLQTEGEDLFQSDWRSLAMLCVVDAEGEGDKTESATEAVAEQPTSPILSLVGGRLQ